MVKVNDQVLAEVGIDLGNEKQLPIANLSDSVVVTLAGEPFRRRLLQVFDTAAPSGANGDSFLATYRSPKDAAVRWFAGSLSNANVKLELLVTAQYDSAAGKKSVAHSFRDIQSGLQANFIGAVGVGTIPQPDYVSESIWVPPDSLLILEFEPEGASWNTNAFNWTIMGWTEAPPRTGSKAEVVKPDKTIVVP